jgi:TDG/mug DNA glycosylase family protein
MTTSIPPRPFKPTRADLLAAADKRVADVIGPNLKVLFVGINPGLYTAAIGHHFGRPGNKFWPAIFAGGFSERLLSPFEERELLERGYGITNVVARASARADELTEDEMRAGARILTAKVLRYKPRMMAVLGLVAYRQAFGRPKAALGLQTEKIGNTGIWLLPNPSGLNAHFQAGDLARLFTELRNAI